MHAGQGRPEYIRPNCGLCLAQYASVSDTPRHVLRVQMLEEREDRAAAGTHAVA